MCLQTTKPASRGEGGFTIVEAVVATLLMGIGVFGASTVFTSASRTAATAEQRSIASNLANAEIELVRALPYNEAAIDSAATDYQSHYQGRPTVSNDGTTTPNRVAPTETIQVNGVTFQITRNVWWAPLDIAGSNIVEGYKVLSVSIAWSDSAGEHSIQHESGLYRGITS